MCANVGARVKVMPRATTKILRRARAHPPDQSVDELVRGCLSRPRTEQAKEDETRQKQVDEYRGAELEWE